MTTKLLGVSVAALGATAFFSLSTALKHRSASSTPEGAGSSGGSVGRFLLASARHRSWLAGMSADAGGVLLQIIALHLGALSVVQPLMITALLFSLLLAHRMARTPMSSREIVGGLVLVTALIGFLLVSGASSPRITGGPQPADHAPALAIGLAAAALAVLCIALARHVPRGGAAALLGIAVGLTYACTAALLKSCSDVALSAGTSALLTSWQLYLLVAAGMAGLVLSQLAFQAGPLRASLPAIATVDPLVSIALGVLVYDEHLRPGWPAVSAELACLLTLCAAAIYLSRLTGAQVVAESAASRSRTMSKAA
jgi:drug/metabolite transporter (DMT)-like permease